MSWSPEGTVCFNCEKPASLYKFNQWYICWDCVKMFVMWGISRILEEERDASL